MTQNRFTLAESKDLAVRFLRRIQVDSPHYFSSQGLAIFAASISDLANDQVGSELWAQGYEVTFGRTCSHQVFLVKEEVLTLLISFYLDRLHRKNIDVREVIRILFGVQFECEDESAAPKYLDLKAIWKDEADKPVPHISPILYTRTSQPQFPLDQNLFNSESSERLIVDYLYKLSKDLMKSISGEDRDKWQDYFDCVHAEPSFNEDWGQAYQRFFGKNLSKKTYLTQQEVFSTGIAMSALFAYELGFCGLEPLNLLILMRYRPEFYEKEWRDWKQTVTEILDNAFVN